MIMIHEKLSIVSQDFVAFEMKTFCDKHPCVVIILQINSLVINIKYVIFIYFIYIQINSLVCYQYKNA